MIYVLQKYSAGNYSAECLEEMMIIIIAHDLWMEDSEIRNEEDTKLSLERPSAFVCGEKDYTQQVQLLIARILSETQGAGWRR